jgi:hypothetical protein
MTDLLDNVQNLNINIVMRLMRLIQLYFWTHSYSSPKWRNLLAWIVGCMLFLYERLQIVLFLSRRC